MTQEDKELLLKDLCARLPYGVKIFYTTTIPFAELKTINAEKGTCIAYDCSQWYRHSKWYIENIKPYLRPMSSMADKELIEFLGIRGRNLNSDELKTFRNGESAIVSTLPLYSRHIDWLNAHHFDFRNLIEKGLAIAVTKENNPYKD